MIKTFNNEYTIATTGEVANMLAHFDDEVISSTIEQSLSMRVVNCMRFMPNIACSYESYFKEQLQAYPDFTYEIKDKEDEVYNNIINILCNFYNLEINNENTVRSFSSEAIHLYDFLVSHFQINIVKFFINYIIAEANGLYEQLELSQYKKHKDSSTIYNKKVWKNPKFALISSNIELVLDNICRFDITFETYIRIVYKDNMAIGNYLLSIVSPKVDFFKYYIACWIQDPDYRAIFITEIRLSLLDLSSKELHDSLINSAKEQENNDNE